MFKLIEGLAELFDPVVSWINNNLITPLIDFFNSIKEGLRALTQAIVDLPQAVGEFIQNLKDKFQSLLDTLKDKIWDVTSWVKDNVIIPLENEIKETSAKLQEAFDILGKLDFDLFTWLKGRFEAIEDFFANIQDRIEAYIENWVKKNVLIIIDKIGEFINDRW
jgi:hypothetical protein